MNRRRTTAAVVLGISAAFLATACGTSNSGSKASATTSATVSSVAPSNAPSGTATASSPAGKSGGSDGSGSSYADQEKEKESSGTGAPAGAPAAPANNSGKDSGKEAGKTPISTTKLVDGSTADIYKLGDTHYYAKVIAHGQLFVSLETTNGHVDGIDANDMFIVLDLDGTIHSWMGGAKQGPGTFTLAGGWKAKVTKIGELHYSAQISGGEGNVATLEANQDDGGRSAGVNANGVYIVLGNDGQISAHS